MTIITSERIKPRNTFNEKKLKIPADLFVGIYKLILKFIWKLKESGIVQIILKRKNKVGGLLNFKTDYKPPGIRSVQYRCEERQTRIEWNPQSKPHFWGQLTFDRDTEWGKESFQQMMQKT